MGGWALCEGGVELQITVKNVLLKRGGGEEGGEGGGGGRGGIVSCI